MDRLTEKQSAGYDLKALNGQWCNHYCHKQNVHTCVDCGIYQAIQKLAHYEEMEESLEKVYGECDELLETAVNHLVMHKDLDIGEPAKSVLLTDEDVEKWKKWKEAEEQGKMMILPCNVNDRIYTFYESNIEYCFEKGMEVDEIMEEICDKKRVTGFYLRDDGLWILLNGGIFSPDYRIPAEEFGKTVFLTEQEEKEALEGMKND